MKVGQNRPSVPTQSTSSTETRKGTTATTAQAPTARTASTFQTGFDTAVRKNTFSVQAAATPVVMTPAPPADAPAEGAKLGDTQLRKLLDEAHQLIFGNKANGANVDGWMAKARELRDDTTKNLDANGIKYALFDLLRGAPSTQQMEKPDAKLLGQLVDQAYQLINGPGQKPDAAKSQELMKYAQQLAGEGKDANTIKYALFDKLRGTPSADQMAKPDDNMLRKMLDEAHQLVFGNKANGANVDGWMKKARELAGQGMDANAIKYALFDELRGAPSTQQMEKPDAKLLGQLVDQAYQLINGPGKKPDAAKSQELMKYAQQLAGEGKDANTIKYALFDKLRGTPSADQMAKPDDNMLRKMLDEAHQLAFGNKANGANVDGWMKKARELAGQGMDANAIKYALFDELRGAPSAQQMAKPDDTMLRKLLDDAHNLVFGNGANGPHIDAWMAKARALRDDTTKNLDANGIKYALFDLMRQVK
ncbi:hypothetical protein NR798_11290 [Archangium gephyra]|uniref:hypothetical protein n=1 Tax=Archangium gephyra TaxID=48 RepID=UPI0035D469E7